MTTTDEMVCFSLYAASRATTQAYRALLEPWGLTYGQYLVLVVLWSEGEQSVSALGEALQLESGTLSPMLLRMEKADPTGPGSSNTTTSPRVTPAAPPLTLSVSAGATTTRRSPGPIADDEGARTTGSRPGKNSPSANSVDVRSAAIRFCTVITGARGTPPTTGPVRLAYPARCGGWCSICHQKPWRCTSCTAMSAGAAGLAPPRRYAMIG